MRILRSLPLLILVLTAGAQAEVRSKSIPYTHNGQSFEGYLAYDDAVEGKRPGVLVVHEWWGLDDYARRRADQLAELGYIAFALDMYGKGKLTEHPAQAREWATQVRANVDDWEQRARKGLEILRSQPQCQADKVAAIGYCFGGSTVLQLAYSGADLDGVVSFHGGLAVPKEGEAEQIRASILICHGAADGFIPEEVAHQVRTALSEAGADWQMVYYSGAKHSFTVPAADQRGIDGIAYNAQADRRSWQDMRDFFREVFAEERSPGAGD